MPGPPATMTVTQDHSPQLDPPLDPGLPAAPIPAPPGAPERLTRILARLAADETRDRIAFADLLTLMQGRAFGALLIIFAFPNILPSPPGLAGVLGLPLVFLSVQMLLGLPPWLPGFIARRSIARPVFAAMILRITPWLDRAERLLTRRLPALSGDLAQRLLGLVCLVLAIALALPVPFANLAPASAICIIGLGILERDGVWILLGLLAALAALIYVSALGVAVFASIRFVIQNAF